MRRLIAGLVLLVALLTGAPVLAATCPSYPFVLANGQTADATQVMANFNSILSCANTNVARAGANADITSLSALLTPLSASQGGTGQSTSIFGSNNTWTGANAYSGAGTYTALQTFSGSTAALASTFPNIGETATVSASAATGTISYDVTTQSVLYYTANAAGNWTLNIRGNSGATLNGMLSTGQSVTVAFLVTQGASPFYNNVVQVDGTVTGVTTKWLGGAPIAGNASGIDAYTYTVLKTGSAVYTVLATQAPFN